jgi:RHS repeat-associated protein
VWLDETLVAVLTDHDASTFQYVETDHTGTPRAIVHPVKNTIVWRWNRSDSAFGEKPAVEDPDANGLLYGLNLRFPGQWYDSETTLHYNYKRDYEPGTGRYVESDPAGMVGGQSTYGYVGGRPLEYVDPAGLLRWTGTMHYGVGSIPGPGKLLGKGGRYLGKAVSLASWTRVMVDINSDCDENKKKYSASVAASRWGGPDTSLLPDTNALGKVVLEDGLAAANVAGLAGTMTVKGSGSLGRAHGTITVGSASGTFDVAGIVTGDLEFSGQGELLPWSGFAPEDCGCEK